MRCLACLWVVAAATLESSTTLAFAPQSLNTLSFVRRSTSAAAENSDGSGLISPSVWEIVPEVQKVAYDEIWLDLRGAQVTFAQQALTSLFYGVRKVVDDAGVPLPQGAGVQGVLYGPTWDPFDAIGSGLPVYQLMDDGIMHNATKGGESPLPSVHLQTAQTSTEWQALTKSESNGLSVVAVPPYAQLWAEALTGATFNGNARSSTGCVEETGY